MAGKYLPSEGATDPQQCVHCKRGSYSAVVGAPSAAVCTKCPAGKYSSILGQIYSYNCTNCSIGTYSENPGADDCPKCAAGKYSGAVGASTRHVCNSCALGKASANLGATSASTCQDCKPGEYAAALGQTVCTKCVAGTYSGATAATNAITCKKCGFGTYSTSVGASEASTCVACLPGKYASTDGNSREAHCILCAAGTYSENPGAAECTKCGQGKYLTTGGASSNTACQDCVKGKYAATDGNALESKCLNCNPGKFSSQLAASSIDQCGQCEAGKFSPKAGASVCELCSEGKYSTTVGSSMVTDCTECDAGTYNTLQGQDSVTACLSCPDNSISPAGSTAKSACLCNAGFTGPSGGSCKICVAGTYKAVLGPESCTLCAAGKKLLTDGSKVETDCLACEEGKYSAKLGLGAECTECSTGRFRPSTGGAAESACGLCPKGKFSPTLGASSCEECVAGKYSTQLGATSVTACLDCAAGKYASASSNDAATDCIGCAPGKFSVTAGATVETTCASCQLGTFVGVEGSTSCVQCLAGSYGSVTGLSACSRCGEGKFSTDIGAVDDSTCASCPPSSWSATGTSTETDCYCLKGKHYNEEPSLGGTCIEPFPSIAGFGCTSYVEGQISAEDITDLSAFTDDKKALFKTQAAALAGVDETSVSLPTPPFAGTSGLIIQLKVDVCTCTEANTVVTRFGQKNALSRGLTALSNESDIRSTPFHVTCEIEGESVKAERVISPEVESAVKLTNGAGVTIPAGALSGTTKIGVLIDPNPPSASGDMTVKSDILTFSPSGTQFSQPVTLSFSMTSTRREGMRIAVHRYNKNTKEWEEKPGTIVNPDGTVAVETYSFSSYGVFEVPKAEQIIDGPVATPTPDAAPTSEDWFDVFTPSGRWEFVSICVGGAVFLAAVVAYLVRKFCCSTKTETKSPSPSSPPPADVQKDVPDKNVYFLTRVHKSTRARMQTCTRVCTSARTHATAYQKTFLAAVRAGLCHG